MSKHRLSKTAPYYVWVSMLRRCTNPSDKDYKNYGGRGITVCSDWMDYPAFYNWMMERGYRKGLTIDRVDNDKGYSPENCRLITHKLQCRNKRNTIFVVFENRQTPLAEVSEKLNIPYQTAWWRYKHNRNIMTGETYGTV